MTIYTRDSAIIASKTDIEQRLLEELMLFAKVSIPPQFVAGTCYSLLKTFGGLAAVMHAPRPDVEKLIGSQKRLLQLMALILKVCPTLARPVTVDVTALKSRSQLMDYIYATMAHMEVEHCRILYLNKRNHLLVDEIAWSGTVDHVKGYPREIVKRALEIGATALIVAHNHPSGDPQPSSDDIFITEQIIAAARPFGICLHDHVIVGKHGHCSMKQLNLLGPAWKS